MRADRLGAALAPVAAGRDERAVEEVPEGRERLVGGRRDVLDAEDARLDLLLCFVVFCCVSFVCCCGLRVYVFFVVALCVLCCGSGCGGANTHTHATTSNYTQNYAQLRLHPPLTMCTYARPYLLRPLTTWP